jgi:hypothetical protein
MILNAFLSHSLVSFLLDLLKHFINYNFKAMDVQKQKMTEKLKEMMLVVRPTKGDGRIPTDELESLLKGLGKCGFQSLVVL